MAMTFDITADGRRFVAAQGDEPCKNPGCSAQSLGFGTAGDFCRDHALMLLRGMQVSLTSYTPLIPWNSQIRVVTSYGPEARTIWLSGQKVRVC